MPRHESHLHGLLLVDKPGLQQLTHTAQNHTVRQPHTATPNASTDTLSNSLPRLYTSHDIVQLVRRWSGQRRIGHTGTLDPMASGLLVLCLGQATRLVEYYQGHDKHYYAEITLGEATDSYDAVGKVIETLPIPNLTTPQIREALIQFTGDILQLPPIYSALKQDGESLHRKARRGEAVTVRPRPVTIYSIDLINYQAPGRLCIRVHCSAGTYIRSLAHDLGHALGCCAHLSLLRREAVGTFTLDQSATLDKIEIAAQAGTFEHLLLPTGANLALTELLVNAEEAIRLGQGQKVYVSTQDPRHWPAGEADGNLLAKIVDGDGHFLGIGRCLKQNRGSTDDYVGQSLWKAEKWLAHMDET